MANVRASKLRPVLFKTGTLPILPFQVQRMERGVAYYRAAEYQSRSKQSKLKKNFLNFF